jgi:class 3 adenylate cyclase
VFWAGVFTVFEVALLVVVVLAPLTFPQNWPPQMQLRLVTVFYLFIYVAGAVLSYSPSLVVWTGALTAAAWGVGHYVMLRLPGTVTVHGPLIDRRGVSPTGLLALYLDPRFVSDAAWRTQTVLLLLLTLILAAAVSRSRSLLRRQVADHLARANLARYFSPNVVDVLASAGPTETAARQQRVAVLFADIRGFTRISETIGAARTMAFVQRFHERVTPVIFEHGGTLEKYIGDAVMATFGTPSPGLDDATRALHCAVRLAAETSRWSAERAARGERPVGIGIGVHYGNAVVGSIGDGQRLDYLVIGDTVNVTSRLERLTREIDAQIVVTDELVTQVRAGRVGHPAARSLHLPRRSPGGPSRSRSGRSGGSAVPPACERSLREEAAGENYLPRARARACSRPGGCRRASHDAPTPRTGCERRHLGVRRDALLGSRHEINRRGQFARLANHFSTSAMCCSSSGSVRGRIPQATRSCQRRARAGVVLV